VKKELISSGVVHMLMLGRQFTNNKGETTMWCSGGYGHCF